MQAHAPLAGLSGFKVLETSMALHKNDAAHICCKKRMTSDE